MKLICDRHMLAEALSAVTAVIPTRTPKPILQCVRLTAEADQLTLCAYDQEMGIRYHVTQVEVNKQGECLVSAERLAGIVRESADETLTIESVDDVLHIRGEDSHFQIYGQNVREFPPVPDFEGEPDFRVKAGPLATAIERSAFAAAKDSTRYAINGVMWMRKGKKLHLIATDGRRLAWTNVALEKSAKEEGASAIVPVKALQLLAKLRPDADETVDVALQPNQVLIRTQRAVISSVLVEGKFPDYEGVIPRDCNRKAEMETHELLSAVKRASLLMNEESKGVKMSFSEDGLVLSSRAPEQGEATIKAHAKFTGAPVEVGFNPIFLIDALKVCGDQVVIELKETGKPGLLKAGPDFLYVVMPVSLS